MGVQLWYMLLLLLWRRMLLLLLLLQQHLLLVLLLDLLGVLLFLPTIRNNTSMYEYAENMLSLLFLLVLRRKNTRTCAIGVHAAS